MQYRFRSEKCLGCGQKLPRKVKPEEIRKGPHPWGCCPKCGRAEILVEIEPKPEAETLVEIEPKPEAEPEAEPTEEPTEPKEKPPEE